LRFKIFSEFKLQKPLVSVFSLQDLLKWKPRVFSHPDVALFIIPPGLDTAFYVKLYRFVFKEWQTAIVFIAPFLSANAGIRHLTGFAKGSFSLFWGPRFFRAETPLCDTSLQYKAFYR